ncbi:MAG: ggt [Chitinophagaceae bacterium]|nr:ggt [Chitinophagaceae bacterium]
MKKTTWLALSFFAVMELPAQKILPVVGPGKTVDPFHYAIRKGGEFQNGVVVTAHPLASKVGAAILQNGGNAFDAAIAVQLTLAVVYPGAGNIGGGGFLIGRTVKGKIVAIDYREKAPAAASKNMYLDADGNAQTQLSQNGHLASGVPGTIAGLASSFKYAKLPWAALVQPAIDLAEQGFAITEREARSLNSTIKDFIKYSTVPSPFVSREVWKAGDTLIQKQLAATLKRIRDNGAKGFYEGETARLIVEEMKRGKGLITLTDLKNYKAAVRDAIHFNYRGYDIYGFPPPSSGGIIVGQLLKMIEPYPIASYGFHSVKATQLMIETERRAYADRAEHLGDPDFWKVPVKTLLSKKYLDERMKDYHTDRASVSSSIKAGVIHESEETTHLSIMDAEGNMVAVTTTLNGGYGSRTVVGGAGFLLNNEMDDFSVKPGVPNMFGAIGNEANAIVPGKRMLSSMAPTLMLKDGQPYVVVGTPGGTTIPTSVFQSIVNIVDFNMTAEDAVNKPKFHHQWLPDEVSLEKGFEPDTAEALKKMGYTIKASSAIGRTELIKITGGKKQAAADKRGDDSVAGY